MIFSSADEGVHLGSAREEFTFAFWLGDGSVGGYTSLVVRADGGTSYACALVRAGQPLLHVAEDGAPKLRSNEHLLLKAEGLWAEHICEVPFEQWTISNETYAAALTDPDDALGRAYGIPTPIAFDLEWYAAGSVEQIEGGYRQLGEVHAVLELPGGPIEDVFSSWRSHRWQPFAWSSAPDGPGARAPIKVDGVPIERRLAPGGWVPAPF